MSSVHCQEVQASGGNVVCAQMATKVVPLHTG